MQTYETKELQKELLLKYLQMGLAQLVTAFHYPMVAFAHMLSAEYVSSFWHNINSSLIGSPMRILMMDVDP